MYTIKVSVYVCISIIISLHYLNLLTLKKTWNNLICDVKRSIYEKQIAKLSISRNQCVKTSYYEY